MATKPADRRLPYFKFFVDDFLGSPTVQIMTAAQVGAYVMLLLASWRGGLHNHDASLAKLSRLGKHWKASREMILSKFITGEDGKLYHPKLLAQQQAMSAYADGQAQRALVAAANKQASQQLAIGKPEASGGYAIAIAHSHTQKEPCPPVSLTSELDRTSRSGSQSGGHEVPIASDRRGTTNSDPSVDSRVPWNAIGETFVTGDSRDPDAPWHSRMMAASLRSNQSLRDAYIAAFDRSPDDRPPNWVNVTGKWERRAMPSGVPVAPVPTKPQPTQANRTKPDLAADAAPCPAGLLADTLSSLPDPEEDSEP